MQIGIVGGMGCGKSTVLSIFEKKGYTIINSDLVVASLFDYTHPQYLSVAQILDNWLGTDFQNERGISKDKIKTAMQLRDNSFQTLALLLRTLIISEIEHIYNQSINPVVEAPLLFEMQMQEKFDNIICVTCEPETQMQRVRNRNPTWSEEEIEAKISAQLPINYKVENSHYVIYNENLASLEQQIDTIIEKIQNKKNKAENIRIST